MRYFILFLTLTLAIRPLTGFAPLDILVKVQSTERIWGELCVEVVGWQLDCQPTHGERVWWLELIRLTEPEEYQIKATLHGRTEDGKVVVQRSIPKIVVVVEGTPK